VSPKCCFQPGGHRNGHGSSGGCAPVTSAAMRAASPATSSWWSPTAEKVRSDRRNPRPCAHNQGSAPGAHHNCPLDDDRPVMHPCRRRRPSTDSAASGLAVDRDDPETVATLVIHPHTTHGPAAPRRRR
jgi:hypothetical protein